MVLQFIWMPTAPSSLRPRWSFGPVLQKKTPRGLGEKGTFLPAKPIIFVVVVVPNCGARGIISIPFMGRKRETPRGGIRTDCFGFKVSRLVLLLPFAAPLSPRHKLSQATPKPLIFHAAFHRIGFMILTQAPKCDWELQFDKGLERLSKLTTSRSSFYEC